ncbi:uncharacterized protein CLUP02_07369 [Colletotrichum lupini]|uniref:Uncharacterized protein n=1 Tax=Colletotrichum lupini TaxID=145971 RepID=A0A9Q8SR23_9PEZI|nr:uncharacterized protein CLUP02_07369 [Colletotrichum lupini]UQC81883.1 hypothetical protein CLUP02_07369 [Colletotrichum lupini]
MKTILPNYHALVRVFLCLCLMSDKYPFQQQDLGSDTAAIASNWPCCLSPNPHRCRLGTRRLRGRHVPRRNDLELPGGA